MGKIVIRDRFILATFPFSFKGKPLVLESSDDLAEVCRKIPDHLPSEDRLSICEVPDKKWLLDDSRHFRSNPDQVVILFEVKHYNNPSVE